jgi:hypothetical protein
MKLEDGHSRGVGERSYGVQVLLVSEHSYLQCSFTIQMILLIVVDYTPGCRSFTMPDV